MKFTAYTIHIAHIPPPYFYKPTHPPRYTIFWYDHLTTKLWTYGEHSEWWIRCNLIYGANLYLDLKAMSEIMNLTVSIYLEPLFS